MIVNTLGTYHFQCCWTCEELSFLILDGDKAMTGKIEQHTFKEIDNKTKNTFGDSWSMAKEAFNGESKNYEFKIENQKLFWRKVGGKAKIKIAEIDLEPANHLEAQNKIVSHLVQSNTDLKTKNADLQRRQDNLVRDIKKSKALLVDMEKEKNSIENSMYETFLPILNAKKNRIAELEGSTHRPSVHAVSDDDYGNTTDEDSNEKEEVNNKPPQYKRLKVALDDSLDLLGDSQ